ncbi:MAG: YCF48-related protein [Pseudomonadota bacterium]|nr:YCF48-related protein [Pseudomonadota bacterium]
MSLKFRRGCVRAACTPIPVFVALASLGGALATAQAEELPEEAPSIVGDPLQPRRPAMSGVDLQRQGWLTAVATTTDRQIAVGAYGVVLVSDDGGRNWRQVMAPTDVTLTCIHMLDDSVGWIGGHESTLMQTVDGGDSWTILMTDPQVEDPVLDIWFSDRHGGFAIGGHSLMLRATPQDGAYQWRKAEFTITNDDFFAPHLFDIAQLPDGGLLVSAEAGHLFRSEDGGRVWTQLDSPYHGSLFGLLPLPDGRMVLYGMLGHAFVSADRGDSWQTISMPVTDSFISDVESPALLAGADGALVALRVGDGTIEPQVIDTPMTRRAITGLLALPGGEWLAATNRGLVQFSARWPGQPKLPR